MGTRKRKNHMSKHNGSGPKDKKAPINLPVIPNDVEGDEEGATYIVVGEAGDDVAFELCEDLDTAIEVRALMIEDGFSVRLFEANELEVVLDEEESVS